MITRLRFKNFKAWQDSGDIRLAPLTVLFGANSAGKTSIPQLLLLLKQTAESPDRKRALQLGDARTRVDLGTYHDAVHNNDTSRPLDIEIATPLDSDMKRVASDRCIKLIALRPAWPNCDHPLARSGTRLAEFVALTATDCYMAQ